MRVEINATERTIKKIVDQLESLTRSMKYASMPGVVPDDLEEVVHQLKNQCKKIDGNKLTYKRF
jgi:hypothetical protein